MPIRDSVMGNSGFDVQADIRGPWRRYLDSLVAFRAELHRYCARLTGNIWDGEDLVQESLARVFSLLGKTDAEITQPRPYLFRTATHLWFDQQRRAQRELTADVHEAAELASGEAEEYRGDDVRSAVAVLMETTSPQERASWILKELCDMSIADIASIVGTTPGAVKSALSRARQRLEGRMSAAHVDAPPRDVVEQFARAIETACASCSIALIEDSRCWTRFARSFFLASCSIEAALDRASARSRKNTSLIGAAQGYFGFPLGSSM